MWFRQVLKLQSISRQNFRVQVKYEIHLCPILSASAPARSRKNGYYEILGVSANSRNGDIKVKLVSNGGKSYWEDYMAFPTDQALQEKYF